MEWLLLSVIILVNISLWIYEINREPVLWEVVNNTSTASIENQKNNTNVTANKDAEIHEFIDTHTRRKQKHKQKSKQNILRFNFDPNRISEDSLRLLGVPARVAQTWCKYRNKGGVFYSKRDIRKIYGLEDTLAVQLEKWIYFTSSKKKNKRQQARISKPSQPHILINQAGTEEWQKLKGIGPYYSRKITGYRTQLGGFNRIEQVRETPGLPDSVYQKIKAFLIIKRNPRKININQTDYITLLKHPYIKKKQAGLIIKYRQQHGRFKSTDEILKIKALDSNFVKRILPYLSIHTNEADNI